MRFEGAVSSRELAGPALVMAALAILPGCAEEVTSLHPSDQGPDQAELLIPDLPPIEMGLETVDLPDVVAESTDVSDGAFDAVPDEPDATGDNSGQDVDLGPDEPVPDLAPESAPETEPEPEPVPEPDPVPEPVPVPEPEATSEPEFESDSQPDSQPDSPAETAPSCTVESCNGIDDDCDGDTDEEDALGCTWWYLDGDSDGWGLADKASCLCTSGGKYASEKSGDCDDSDPTVNPGVEEACNGHDDDCDGQADEPAAKGCVVRYRDHDGDGFGITGDAMCLCAASGEYTAILGGDCDDSDPERHPGASVCGKDGDCDGNPVDPLEGCDDLNAIDWDKCGNSCRREFFDDFVKPVGGWFCGGATCDQALKGGSLVIKPCDGVSTGDPTCSGGQPFRNVYIRKPPAGLVGLDFEVVARLSAADFAFGGSKAGIVLWSGPDDFAAVFVERKGTAMAARLHAEGYGIASGSGCAFAQDVEGPALVAGATPSLGLEVHLLPASQAKVVGRLDGKVIGEVMLPAFPPWTDPGAGVMALGTAPGEPCAEEKAAGFDWFRVNGF